MRNHIVDWVLLEGGAGTADFTDALIDLLERLRELKTRPPEINSWNDAWFEAHGVFVYETFLYIVAALLKVNAFPTLREVFTSHYLIPEADRHGEARFAGFDTFYGYSETLNKVLAEPGRQYHSAAAELIKRQADREDVRFSSVMEAELLVLLMSFLIPDIRWYPQTLHYASHGGEFPLFLRATQRKHFKRLSLITGIDDADKLRATVKDANERMGADRWNAYRFHAAFWNEMNMDKLDTLR